MKRIFESAPIIVTRAELDDPNRRAGILRKVGAVSRVASFDFTPELEAAIDFNIVEVVDDPEVVDSTV